MTDKTFYVQYNIGKAKYVINWHNGKQHPDGSKFYDVAIRKNKRQLEIFLFNLRAEGYKEEGQI